MVWHHSLPLINSFNKTEAAVFPCRLCFLGVSRFISLICLVSFVEEKVCGSRGSFYRKAYAVIMEVLIKNNSLSDLLFKTRLLFIHSFIYLMHQTHKQCRNTNITYFSLKKTFYNYKRTLKKCG